MNPWFSNSRERGVPHDPSAPTFDVVKAWVSYPASPRGFGALQDANGKPTAEERFALEEISFQVQTGQRVAVVGPNGAGKSTLFKLLVGTLKPKLGHIRVFGREPGKHICIAYVPQRRDIDWSFPVTVEDVVMMGRVGQIGLLRWPRRGDWDLVRDCLARVNAAHLAKKQIGELSGGQQQRVFIARALAQQADALLLDEPFAGLDLPSHEAIFEILDSIRIEAVTTIVATHDLNMAAERFDRVMLLNRRIIAYGQAENVLTAANLVRAYGGHLHVLGDEKELLLADTCCEDDGSQI